MGYGARLGFGCNIGAMFNGIASASLHGWILVRLCLRGFAAGYPASVPDGSRDLRGRLFVLILADHFSSATFARSSGVGGVETSYTQRDESACAPCGALCLFRREGDG